MGPPRIPHFVSSLRLFKAEHGSRISNLFSNHRRRPIAPIVSRGLATVRFRNDEDEDKDILLDHADNSELTLSSIAKNQEGRERVVILGSGWAGYTLCRTLDHRKYQIVIVSPRSYFVFTPLLASTTVGTLEFRTAVEPIRTRRNKASYIQGWADDVDLYNKTVTIEEAVADPNTTLALTGPRHEGKDEKQMLVERANKSKKGQLFNLKYDKLIIAVGAYSQTFNTPGVKEYANFLKDVGDARKIRKRLLECFETAALPTTRDEIRKQILTFAIVGGGPTGIEFSAELYDFIHEDMARIYPELIKFTKITVYDVAPKILTAFDDKLARYAADVFSRNGIEIKTSRKIARLSQGLPDVEPELRAGQLGLTLSVDDEPDQGIGMCIWSTGLMMNPFIQKALTEIRQFPTKEVIFKSSVPEAETMQWHIYRDPKTGSIMTSDKLRVMIDAVDRHGTPHAYLRDVFAIGDCAVIQHTKYPATAQVANQKAKWLATRLNKGDLAKQRFKFVNLGIMALLPQWKSIYQGGKGMPDMSGRAAWFMWRGAYLAKSISWRNRVLIPIYWFLNWVFGRDISRF